MNIIFIVYWSKHIKILKSITKTASQARVTYFMKFQNGSGDHYVLAVLSRIDFSIVCKSVLPLSSEKNHRRSMNLLDCQKKRNCYNGKEIPLTG